MPRLRKTDYQFDLFSSPVKTTTVEIPSWQSLSTEVRQKVTALMARVILQSAARASEPEGERHDQ